MTITTKVTVIVPVFNVENYLKSCIDSILAQSLTDFEIILINDCSTDDSEKIITEYIEADSRVKYIKQEQNQGQGIARNTAIKNALGEYILFVDSDDYIHENSLEVLYTKSKELDLDFLESSYYKVFHKNHSKQPIATFEEVLTGEEYLEQIPFTVGVIWNKLWKTSFIKENNLSFSSDIFEDVRFFSDATEVAKKVYRIDFPFYFYIERDNSTMTSVVSKKHIDSQMALLRHLEKCYLNSKGKKGSHQRLKIFAYSFVSLSDFLTRFKPKNDSLTRLKHEAQDLLSKKHKLYRNDILRCKKLGVIQKILIYLSPIIMNKFLKIYR